jgi:hypothetical protein
LYVPGSLVYNAWHYEGGKIMLGQMIGLLKFKSFQGF